MNLSQISQNSSMLSLQTEETSFFDSDINHNHYPYALEKQLYQAITDCDLEQIKRIGYVFSSYPSSVLCQNNSIRSLKNNLICSCTLITRVAIESGLDEKYAFFLSDLYINKVESLNHNKPLINLYTVMILDFMNQIKNCVGAKSNHYSTLTKKTIQFINQNIYSHFTLSEVANYVHTNSSYLSRIFKKDVGISFNQYIHNVRIKKAQHLLLFSNLSLVQISSKLGYANQSHFNKMFKKINGITPKQFIQNNSGLSI